jgi:signal transduction histidine kinase
VGLGLALARELAHALGTEIVVEGRAPEGTTFSLLLPVSALADRAAPRERAENGRP